MTKYACYICDQKDPCTVNIPDKKAYKIIWPFRVCVVKREKEPWGY